MARQHRKTVTHRILYKNDIPTMRNRNFTSKSPVCRGRKQQIPGVVCYERVKANKFLQKFNLKLLHKFACHLKSPQPSTLTRPLMQLIVARVKKLLTDGWLWKEIPNFTTLHCITYSLLKVLLVLINFNMQMINRMFSCYEKT